MLVVRRGDCVRCNDCGFGMPILRQPRSDPVPFKLDKDAAVAALNDYYKGKKFLPKKFIAANKVEHIQGVYVPFWLYDGSVEGSGTFECRNERTCRSGDEEVTRTTVYETYRAGDLDFERVPVDGSASRTISTR